MKLTIDSDKIGYVRLPNGVMLQTVAGVINTMYTGISGGIIYYVPKTNAIIADSGLLGNIIYNGAFALTVNQTNINTINAEKATQIFCLLCGGLTELIATKVITINANNCALTAKSIGDILYQAYIANRANVNYNFSGGMNASATAINAYLLATYGVTLTTVKNALIALGGIITNNA